MRAYVAQAGFTTDPDEFAECATVMEVEAGSEKRCVETFVESHHVDLDYATEMKIMSMVCGTTELKTWKPKPEASSAG